MSNADEDPTSGPGPVPPALQTEPTIQGVIVPSPQDKKAEKDSPPVITTH